MKRYDILSTQYFQSIEQSPQNMMYPAFFPRQTPKTEHKETLQGLNIEQKIDYITKWYQTHQKKTKTMLYMILYDIENDKIRTHIAKYLIRRGCMRIQKSVYIAKGPKREMKEITQILTEINEAYENHDSIFVLPIPQDKFNNMRIIGKNISFEMVTKPKNVYIF